MIVFSSNLFKQQRRQLTSPVLPSFMRAKCVKNVRAQVSLFPPYKLSDDAYKVTIGRRCGCCSSSASTSTTASVDSADIVIMFKISLLFARSHTNAIEVVECVEKRPKLTMSALKPQFRHLF